MTRGLYLNEEHKSAVLEVLAAKGRVAKEKRTLKMLQSNKRTTAMADAIDTAQARVKREEQSLDEAKRKYFRYIDKNRGDLFEFWTNTELFEGEE